jgi:hypothetical protein
LWNFFDENCDLTTITVHPDNPAYASESGVLFNKDKTELIAFPNGRKGDYVVPDSVVKIGDYAFWACNLLTSVTISASVIKIGRKAFSKCYNLTTIMVHPDNPVYTSENGIIRRKRRKKINF